jgi:branched-chain amino acid transport system substrate-binding protein
MLPAVLPRASRSALLLSATLLVSCSRGPGGSGETVVFGLAGPMEQSYGESTRLGAELAVKEVNAAGGVGGRRLELSVQDDQASSERAPAVAKELAGDPRVVAVVGHVNSGTTRAAGGVYAEHGLPALATTATSPLISQLGDWVFRIASSDSANAVFLAKRAREITPRTAILYANDDYGRGLAASFRTAYLADGGTVVEEDPFVDETQDFTPYLQRLQRKDVGLVFIAGLDASSARIISQARSLGLASRFIGGDGLEPLVGMGPTYEGTMVGTLYHPQASDEARKFAETYRKAYGRDPDGFAATAYDAVKLLARAAEKGGAGRAAIQKYLSVVGRDGKDTFEGATGPIRFDENGDPTDKDFTVGVIRNGKIELLRGQR